ncbi:hypothetical protein FOZ60_003183 [Perkinsus olseni]|uniref:Carboxypeptidase n=4 Tax=Perkinsus olseni TaxID=32597 RepID=A0A7J6NW98_PEROL|nr:hypothetical protein FOZ60_003183 [Perkinsus olseni]
MSTTVSTSHVVTGRSSFLTHLSRILLLTAALSCTIVNGESPLSNLRGELTADASSLPGFGPVTQLPGYDHSLPEGTQAGYLPLYKKHKQCVTAIYFTLVPSADDPNKDPVVLWLQGGPGTSGLIGFFLENGPVRAVQAEGKLVENSQSWHKNATFIVVDQPAPVGMSFVTDDSCLPESEDEAIRNLGDSISLLLRSYFPHLKKLPFYVFGESYGGKYVPELAVDLRERHPWVNLQGVGVGDGWVDPPTQQMTYKEFAFQHGLINGPDAAEVEKLEQECLDALEETTSVEAWRRANDVCSRIEDHIVNNSRVNMYDVRLYGDYDNVVLTQYLRDPEVRAAMNVDPRAAPWSEDNAAIAYILAGWEQRSASHLYTQLLHNSTRTLLYNGMYDMDCNMIGTARWMLNMDWELIEEFKQTKRKPWSIKREKVARELTPGQNGGTPHEVEDIVGGFVEVGALTHVVINQAGHLVPMDVPHIASHMLYSFTRNCSFSDDACRDGLTGMSTAAAAAARAPEAMELVPAA